MFDSHAPNITLLIHTISLVSSGQPLISARSQMSRSQPTIASNKSAKFLYSKTKTGKRVRFQLGLLPQCTGPYLHLPKLLSRDRPHFGSNLVGAGVVAATVAFTGSNTTALALAPALASVVYWGRGRWVADGLVDAADEVAATVA